MQVISKTWEKTFAVVFLGILREKQAHLKKPRKILTLVILLQKC